MGSTTDVYKAAVVSNHGKDPNFEVVTLAITEPGPNDVLIKLSATGVCGTDFSLASGVLGPTASVLGHEGIGRVIQLGSAVPDGAVTIGQRTGVAWIRDVCGECSNCLTDAGETRCLKQVFSGREVDGTWAQYAIVPYRYLLRLPEGIADEMLAPVLCGGVTAYKALKICGAIPGSWIAISGASGGVGALGIQYAKAMGYRVIAIDAGPDKRKHCLDLGAEHYIDAVADQDTGASVKGLTEGKGVAAVLVVAGVGVAYQSALGLLAPFGTLVCVGIPPPNQTLTIHPLFLIDSGIRIIGSLVGSRGDILEAVDFVQRGVVTPLVQKIKLEDLNEVGKKMKLGEVIGKYVITFD